MASKKLSTHKKIAKSLRKTRGKVIKKKKPVVKKKPAAKKKVVKKLSTHKKIAKSLRKTQGKPAKVEGTLIGSITHYFPHVQAAVIKLKGPLTTGETVKIKGHTTDITQAVASIQIDRVAITSAKKGDEIGLQVISRVRQLDKVYKV